MLTATEIRQKFLEYFEGKGHTPVSSSSLVPKDDPTLLFTNAGMVQFKKTFLGQEKRDYVRATTSQKCLRVGGKHNDLENVGRTARHHTFFEMLGNFSFGDYFKEDAIRYAWDFITGELGLPKDKLYITIYKDDDEAGELWQKVAGVAPEMIYRLGEKDNFWSMGDTGPCGPCSEIHIDQGEHMKCGPNCGIGQCDCDRYLEIWNLVFMQYDQSADGTREPLPRPSIDTGMGLERIAAVCQGVNSNYDTDLFLAIIGFTAELAGVKYKEQGEDVDTALRVIADHSRSIAFMIADGILPSNEGRGYVLRRLIRRALRFGKLIGQDEAFLFKVALKVVDEMGDHYPELKDNQEFMAKVVREEENRFSQTLDKGLAILEEELEKMRGAGETIVSGEFAFKLYDTFGFPVDIVNDVAEKQGMSVDEAGFKAFMQEQKNRAKAAWKGGGEQTLAARFQSLLEDGLRSEFVGYDFLKADSRIVALLGESAEPVESLDKGAKGYLVTSSTPFYGESGGQEGDSGAIHSPSGKVEVTDTMKPAPELIVHAVTCTEGQVLPDQEVQMIVEEGQRTASARNHTSTHLLHAALRKILGDHVKQAGSLVGPDRLRFDFTHIAAMTVKEKAEVEREVTRAVLADIPLEVAEMEYDAAVEKGAMALFGEKYDSTVRVVSVPGESVELCGGTHLRSTGQAGPFMILSESGVAAGVRRIEAATGWNAINQFNAIRLAAEKAAEVLKGSPAELPERVLALNREVKKLKKDIEKIAAQAASSAGGADIMDSVEELGGIKVLAAKVNAPNMGAMRKMMDDVRSKLASGVACLICEAAGKANVAIYVSKDLHDRFTAPALIKDVAAEVGGSGGGRPDMAQAGGTNPAGIEAALTKLRALLAG
ncbi:alanine--tRNA ligase [Desulfovibrio ferrophilus]|uniref:Alanine--tRNA ligase n=1 Tax=Desulfovibrio ferrophilus TaxID=241368 RepID=A0A2Z6B0E6_9BACT|nr:alanine--tRNA ligase [Desulfovibrio ferrophilus]BBD08981.1 alanyl-tRNA synthetase [Desulfovibrio ferrophilus]